MARFPELLYGLASSDLIGGGLLRSFNWRLQDTITLAAAPATTGYSYLTQFPTVERDRLLLLEQFTWQLSGEVGAQVTWLHTQITENRQPAGSAVGLVFTRSVPVGDDIVLDPVVDVCGFTAPLAYTVRPSNNLRIFGDLLNGAGAVDVTLVMNLSGWVIPRGETQLAEWTPNV